MRHSSMKRFFATAAWLSLVFVIGVSISRFAKGCVFYREVEGHLALAANASSIETAERELSTAILAIEARGLTQGYTSIFYNTPDEDLGFWYGNLVQARADLRDEIDLPGDALRQTNILMKLRETLLEHGDHGEHVTCPEGASIFGSNGTYFVLFAAGFFVLILAALAWFLMDCP